MNSLTLLCSTAGGLIGLFWSVWLLLSVSSNVASSGCIALTSKVSVNVPIHLITLRRIFLKVEAACHSS